MPPTYEYLCDDCSCVTEAQYKHEERPKTIYCKYCGEPAYYMMSAPMIMRASFPDGTKRPGFAELKEAAKIEQKAAVERNPETVKQMKKEADNLRRRKIK